MPRHAASNTKTSSKKSSDIATKNLGLVYQRCLYWYKRLPPEVKVYYDLEDMVNDVVLHVFRMRHKYDDSRGKDSTWVWHTADNKCKSILSHHRTRQYSACDTVKIEDNVPNTDTSLSTRLTAPDTMEQREALNAVEKVIEASSDAARDLLEQIFSCAPEEGLSLKISLDCIQTSEVAHELRWLAARCSATLQDFITVYHTAVAE